MPANDVAVRWRGLLAVAPVRGRCPNCATRIGPPAGAVEMLAAAVLAVLAVRAPSAWLLAAWSWAALFGIALALIDFAVLRLPSPLTATAFSGVMALLALAAAATNQPHALVRAVVAAVGLGLLYLIAVLAPGGGMGPGDARLAPVIGACLGWLSITAVLQATAAAILVSALYVLVMLAIRRLHRRDPVPAGAFMLLGAFLLLASGTAG
jgi:leader peptidase (prepilin peptidase)/N-methyltransferase